MITAIRNYFIFLWRCGRIAFVGDWRYYAWMGLLTVFCMLGLNAYAKQFVAGLITTGMSDQVSWGVYIANFTFLVGIAAAAVMLVIPAYIYKNEDLHDLVIFGELLAVAAIVMCLAFVTVDLGRPDRFWHLIPGIGPQSAGDGIDMVIDRAGKPEIAVHRVADRLYRKSIGIIIWELFRRGEAVRPGACESVSPADPASFAHPGTWRSERTRKRFA